MTMQHHDDRLAARRQNTRVPTSRRLRVNRDRQLVYVVQRGDDVASILRWFKRPPQDAVNLFRYNPRKRLNHHRGVPIFRSLMEGERLRVPPNWVGRPRTRLARQVDNILTQLASADLQRMQDGDEIRVWNFSSGPDHFGNVTHQLGKLINQRLGDEGDEDDGFFSGADDFFGGDGGDGGGSGFPNPFGPDEGDTCDADNGMKGTIVNGVCVPWDAPNTGQECYDVGTGHKGIIQPDGTCLPDANCPDWTVPKNGDPAQGCVEPDTPCDPGNGNPSGGYWGQDGSCIDLAAGGQSACGGTGCNTNTTTWNGSQCVLNSYGQGRLDAADIQGGGWEYDACKDTYYNTVLGQSGLANLPQQFSCTAEDEYWNGTECVKIPTGSGPTGATGGGNPTGGGGNPTGGGGNPTGGTGTDSTTGVKAKSGLSTGAKFGLGALALAAALLAKKAYDGSKGGKGKKSSGTRALARRR